MRVHIVDAVDFYQQTKTKRPEVDCPQMKTLSWLCYFVAIEYLLWLLAASCASSSKVDDWVSLSIIGWMTFLGPIGSLFVIMVRKGKE